MLLRTTLLATILLVGCARSTLVRLRGGDSFTPEPLDDASCGECVAGSARSGAACDCACLPEAPVFRDDVGVCVDDVLECQLAPFVNAAGTQRVPFVFLPLRGQIVNPSAAITFPDANAPVCVVSGAQLLTSGGWTDIRNGSAFAEPPFRLFRDEGRTFLQWLGEPDLRASLEGRLVLVRMLCKEVAQPRVFSPCAAFRVAGSPGVREVTFDLLDADAEASSGLSGSEVAAVGVCAVLLGLVYAASVLLYVHVRRRRKPASTPASLEGGVVKRNPLLQPPRRPRPTASDNETSSEDDVSEQSSELPDSEEDNTQMQTTSALVHMRGSDAFEFGAAHELVCHAHAQEPERRPEQNVSIVETPGGPSGGDERDLAAACGALSNATFRRKLYFNPAYFEPELLAMPPPAALDFLSKIREVITLAKHKMSAKRFSPTLLVIPEELPPSASPLPRTGSVISLKRDNSRHVSWCEPSPPLAPCCGGESKHSSIRRWLADVPGQSEDGPPRKRQAPPRPVAQTGTVVKKKLMDAVIKELTRAPSRYDADSLERGKRGCLDDDDDDDPGFHTPSDYADVRLEEELVARNAVYTRDPVLSADGLFSRGGEDDGAYEPVEVRSGYSLVSEVYVNDAFGSDGGSSPRPPRIRYAHPGHLTIELPPVALPADVEDFEPDTLDRPDKKPSVERRETYVDSLERHAHILLRTDGSFRAPASLPPPSPLGRAFGSLREIYEARAASVAGSTRSLLEDLGTRSLLGDEGTSARRRSRLARRQRVPPSTFCLPPATYRPSPANTFKKPPPTLPPRPPKPTHVIYEVPRPLTARPPARPPLPPKAARGAVQPRSPPQGIAQRPLPALPATDPVSSADSLNSSDDDAPVPDSRRPRHRPEDSGYLSSDSAPTEPPSDETDVESFDAASESGAESVATDSFFFGQRAPAVAREAATVA